MFGKKRKVLGGVAEMKQKLIIVHLLVEYSVSFLTADIYAVALLFCQTKTSMVLLEIQYMSLFSLHASGGTK